MTPKPPVKLLFLPGDGVGPEVLSEVRKVVHWFDDMSPLAFDITEGFIGGAAYERYGQPYPPETRAQVSEANAVMLGGVGGPQWANVGFEVRPEQGVYALREDMGLHVRFLPVFCFDSMLETSPLKPSVVRGLDILIVRELMGGLYHGNPRGVEDLGDDGERGFNTASYATNDVKRVAHEAFKAAMRGNKRVCNVDKANVLESMRVWRTAVSEVAQAYPEVELVHLYADTAAQTLVRDPRFFDVVLAPNLMGEMMTSVGAAMTGTPSMLPSASLGKKHARAGVGTSLPALYEPVHGSVPALAGTGDMNPLAAILSFSMLVKHSLNRKVYARGIVQTVMHVLEEGHRTTDILPSSSLETPASPSSPPRLSLNHVSTAEMGDLVVQNLGRFVKP